MNDLDAQLEQELTALRPRPVSKTLERHIEAELTVHPAKRSFSDQRWAWAVAGGVLALVLLLAVLSSLRHANTETDLVHQNIPIPIALDPSRPSVWAYHRALADPAVDLNELLDEHRGTPLEHPAAQPSAFPVSSFKQPSWMGEL